LPYSKDCFLREGIARVGINDTFQRNTWCSRRDLRKVNKRFSRGLWIEGLEGAGREVPVIDGPEAETGTRRWPGGVVLHGQAAEKHARQEATAAVEAGSDPSATGESA
jgi:hypothetical protein